MSDWDSVTVLRKRQPKASAMKTEGAINQVRTKIRNKKSYKISISMEHTTYRLSRPHYLTHTHHLAQCHSPSIF